MPEVWGPELQVFAEAFGESNDTELGILSEFTLKGMRRFLHGGKGHVNESNIIEAASYTEPDVAKLYSDFVQHCWPSVYMLQFPFNQYMKKVGFINQVH